MTGSLYNDDIDKCLWLIVNSTIMLYLFQRNCKNSFSSVELVWLLLALACFAFFYFYYPYHLFHKEQILLFTYTESAFRSYWEKPAFLSCLIGDFLTQFFVYRLGGPFLVSGVLFLLSRTAYMLLRRFMSVGIALGLVVLLFVWEAMRHTGLHYTLSSSLSLLGGCLMFMLIERIRYSLPIRLLLQLLCLLIGYILFGYGIYIAAICLFSSELLRKKRKNTLGAAIVLFCMLAIPYVAKDFYHQTLSQAYTAPASSWWEKPDFLHEELLALDVEASQENWDEVLRLSASRRPVSAVRYYRNLAYAMKGELPDRLLREGVPALSDLFIPITSHSSYLSTLFAGEGWYQMGDLTMAEHATLLGMIFSPTHKGSRMIKRLAEIQLLQGDSDAVLKYLYILSHTFYYRDWAAQRMPNSQTPAVKEWLSCRQQLLTHYDTLRISTVDIEKSLRLLIKSNPCNYVARDYLLCSHLLRKDIHAFLQDYQSEPGVAPKRLYAEALLIDLVRRKAGAEEIRRTIVDSTVMHDFKLYNRLFQQSGNNPEALAPQFGHTYWFYFHFVKPQ